MSVEVKQKQQRGDSLGKEPENGLSETRSGRKERSKGVIRRRMPGEDAD